MRSLKTMRRRETTRAMRAVQMSAGDKDRSGFHHVRLGNEVNNNGRSHDKYNYKPVLFWVVFDKVSCKTENLLHFSEKFEDLYLPGSPEAVARPRFPQNVACRFPALRSSHWRLIHRAQLFRVS